MCHCISIAGRVKTEVLEAGVRSRRFEVCNQTVAQVDEGVFNPSFIGGWEHCCHSYIPSEAQISAYPVDSVIVTTLGDSPLTSDFAGEANIPADVLSRKGQVNIPDFQNLMLKKIEYPSMKTIKVWQSLEACVFLPTGALINHLGESVRSEQLLLTGGQWGCLRVWHPTTGRCLLEVKGPLDRAPVTADGTVLTSKDRESIDYGLHSIVDLQLAHVLPTPDSSTSSGSPTDLLPKLILVRQSNHVEFYDPMIAKLTAEFLGDIGQVDQLCIVGKSHNHLLLADASPHLKLFVNPCGLSACSKEMDKGGKGSWSCHLVPGGHEDVITDLTVSTCGQWIVSGSKDQSLCLWQVVDRDLTLPGKGPLTKVVLVNRLLNAHSAHISAVCFNKSTNLLVSSADDNVLKAWTIKFDKPDVQKTANFHNVELAEWSVVHNAHQACVNAIDVSVNDQLVATASRDKTVKIWTVTKTGLDCFGVLQGHRRGVWSVCFSAREKVVLTASGDGDVRLWNLKDFSCIR
ncbi:WD domain, G-beta repeat protein, partial [Opisthorchis viverrini]